MQRDTPGRAEDLHCIELAGFSHPSVAHIVFAAIFSLFFVFTFLFLSLLTLKSKGCMQRSRRPPTGGQRRV